MKRRRSYLWIIAALSFLALGSTYFIFYLTSKTPMRAAYDRLQMGMAKRDIDKLFADVPREGVSGDYSTTIVDWQGEINGEIQTSRIVDAACMIEALPKHSRLFIESGVKITYEAAGVGSPLYDDGVWIPAECTLCAHDPWKRCQISSKNETVYAIISQEDRLIERAIFYHGPAINWKNTALDIWHRVWRW